MSTLSFASVLLWVLCAALIVVGILLVSVNYGAMRKARKKRSAFSNETVLGLFLGLVAIIVGGGILGQMIF